MFGSPIGAMPRILELVDELVDHLTAVMGCHVDDATDTSTHDVPDDLLVIGVSSSDEDPGYSSALELQDGMGSRYLERFSIRCALSTYDGAASVRQRRARAGALLKQLHDELRSAALLGGAAQRLRLGETFGAIPVRDGEGAAIGLLFTIEGVVLS